MNVMAFIPKEDDKLPENYGLTVSFLDGKTDEFEVASHRLGEKVFEFVTKEDVWNWVPLTAVKRIEFDKRFSQIIAIKEKSAAEDKK